MMAMLLDKNIMNTHYIKVWVTVINQCLSLDNTAFSKIRKIFFSCGPCLKESLMCVCLCIYVGLKVLHMMLVF